MDGLEDEYAGRVTFQLIPAKADGFKEDVARYELETHGLVGFDAAGEVVVTLPGHNFGREEIVAAVERVLGS